ncbi:endonuclease domain-containing 1 protein-like [Salvelinus alpinus]
MLHPGLPQSAPAEAQPPAPGVPSTSGTSGPGGTTFYPSSLSGEHLIINSLTGLPPGACLPSTRFHNRYHFAMLYNTNHRIAVYSAYRFQPSNGGGREKRWFVEPQFIFPPSSWGAEMQDGYWLGKYHPGVYLGERQTLNEDYTHSGFDRGHLNPNGHHAAPSRNATFTLTNVVPQNPKLNQNAWACHESKLTDLFKAQCAKACVLVGAIPSTDNWIVKNNVRCVNIPEYIWNAYCCVDNNGKHVHSGGATTLNAEQN